MFLPKRATLGRAVAGGAGVLLGKANLSMPRWVIEEIKLLGDACSIYALGSTDY